MWLDVDWNDTKRAIYTGGELAATGLGVLSSKSVYEMPHDLFVQPSIDFSLFTTRLLYQGGNRLGEFSSPLHR